LPAANSRTQRLAATYEFKRKTILDAARRLIDRDGVHALSIRAIAAEAGYSPGAVYSYFANREELALELVCQDLGQIGRRLKTAAAAEPPPGSSLPHVRRLAALAETTLDALQRQTTLAHFAGLVLDPERHPADADVGRSITGRILQILAVLLEAYEDRDELSQSEKGKQILIFASLLLGLSILEKSGRMQLLGFTSRDLIDYYLEKN